MSKTKQTSIMSLSALRPELYRVVPGLAERQEEIHITHHGRVVAVLSPHDESKRTAWLLALCDLHLDGWRLERGSSKTTRADRAASGFAAAGGDYDLAKEAEGPGGDYRAKTGNGPWLRGRSASEALERMLSRRFGERWLQEHTRTPEEWEEFIAEENGGEPWPPKPEEVL